jgi:CDP-diacylglycerol--serine O-phosphatidyltransferase
MIRLAPNSISLGNLFFGLYAIRLAIGGNALPAAYAILAAMFFDFLDGAAARVLHAESEFGSQLDSLVDLVSFGIAPVILASMLFLQEGKTLWWVTGLLYAGCGVIRLARHNVHSKETGKGHFSGLPIPAAAGLIVSSVIAYLTTGALLLLFSIQISMVTTAFLMVSRIRYPRFQADTFRRRPLPVLACLSLFLAGAALRQLHFVLLFCFAVYLLAGPVSGRFRIKGGRPSFQ